MLPPRRMGWWFKPAGDKGYGYPRVRAWLDRRMIRAVIPQRSDQRKREPWVTVDKRASKRRSVVERCVGWLKERRRPCTRSDKLATASRPSSSSPSSNATCA